MGDVKLNDPTLHETKSKCTPLEITWGRSELLRGWEGTHFQKTVEASCRREAFRESVYFFGGDFFLGAKKRIR